MIEGGVRIEVPMRILDRIGSIEGSAPGDAVWSSHHTSPHPKREASLLYWCPCGCGELNALNVIPIDDHRTWTWDGNRLEPTIEERIEQTTDCGWSGWLRRGVFVR